MLLLWSSDPSGCVFLKTDQLDGETDWKVRESLTVTMEMINRDINSIFDSTFCVQAMEPSEKIYEFNGTFFTELYSDNYMSLRLRNTLWANTTLATGECIG